MNSSDNSRFRYTSLAWMMSLARLLLIPQIYTLQLLPLYSSTSIPNNIVVSHKRILSGGVTSATSLVVPGEPPF